MSAFARRYGDQTGAIAGAAVFDLDTGKLFRQIDCLYVTTAEASHPHVVRRSFGYCRKCFLSVTH